MAGLGEVLRLLLEKSWTIGLLLFVTGGGAWVAVSHGQRMPPMVDEWALPAALLGVALIVLSAVNASMAGIGASFSARRQKSKEADEAISNLSTLNLAQFHALAEILNDGVIRISLHHGSLLAEVWRKGLLVGKRQESMTQSICEVHPAVVAVRDQIIAQWRKDLQEGRVPEPPDQSLGSMRR